MNSKKPKCDVGQSCGLACIENSDSCKSKLNAANISKLAKVANSLSSTELVPFSGLVTQEGFRLPESKLLPKWALSESSSKAVSAMTLLILSKTDGSLSEAEAKQQAVALKSWLGTGYQQMSSLTYKANTDSSLIDKDEERLVLGNAIRGLKNLPAVTFNGLLKAYTDHEDLDVSKPAPPVQGEPLNRWIKLSLADTATLVSKYKPGSTVTENGMFGTTYLSASDMGTFGHKASVSYKVNPKLDGSGAGRVVDQYKNSAYEGEVLYVPGTKFKVDKVESNLAEVSKFQQSKESTALYNYLQASPSSINVEALTNKAKLWKAIGEKPYAYKGNSQKMFDDNDVKAAKKSIKGLDFEQAKQKFEELGVDSSMLQLSNNKISLLKSVSRVREIPVLLATVYMTEL